MLIVVCYGDLLMYLYIKKFELIVLCYNLMCLEII